MLLEIEKSRTFIISFYFFYKIESYYILYVYSFPKADIQRTTNRCLTTKQVILSQFWRLEIWNRGVGRAIFPWRFWGRTGTMPFSQLPVVASNPWCSPACSYITLISLCLHCLVVFFFWVSLSSLLTRIQIILDQGLP